MPVRIDLDVRALTDLYSGQKMSVADIAKTIGFSKNTIRDRLLNAGIQFEPGDRISRKALGRPSPRRGAILSEEARQKISTAKLGNKNCVGRVLSEESRARMRASMQGRSRYAPGVAAQIDAERQKFKRILKSLLRAAKIKKSGRTADILGYSRPQLVAHIERQFDPGMSWSDRATFSIDHRIPVAEFIRRGITDPKIVCSLANLQPMAPKANREKSDKYEGDFATDLDAILLFNQRSPLVP